VEAEAVGGEKPHRRRAAPSLRADVAPGGALGEGEVLGLLDEACELRDRDRSAIDRETADLHVTHRRLFGVEVGRAHPEAAPRDLEHVLAAHPNPMVDARRCSVLTPVG
jgi:hypothetical protein